ncbi:MAG: hypothetical protein P3W93_009695, partial [Thermus sp.]|nr:hypothetical protein [Thermus sp.]
SSPPPPGPSQAARGPKRVDEVVANLLANLPPLRKEALRVEPPAPQMDHLPFLVDRLLKRYPEATAGLSPAALTVYRWLLIVGIARLDAMGKPISKALREVLAFAPNEALMAALGIPERTFYRAIGDLKEAGLIVSRPYRSPAVIAGKAGLYAAGTLYAVRLPHKAGRPRLYAEDFRTVWRDLQADIEAGRTVNRDIEAWYGGKGQIGREVKKRRLEAKIRGLAESYISPLKGELEILRYLLSWSLSPSAINSPLAYDSAKSASAAFLSQLLRSGSQARRRLVEEVALGLAKEFRDPGSTRFYAWTIWEAFRAELYGYAPGAMRTLLWAIERVRGAVRAGGVRRPGALLASLLKGQGLLDLFRQAPSWRVA